MKLFTLVRSMVSSASTMSRLSSVLGMSPCTSVRVTTPTTSRESVITGMVVMLCSLNSLPHLSSVVSGVTEMTSVFIQSRISMFASPLFARVGQGAKNGEVAGWKGQISGTSSQHMSRVTSCRGQPARA